MDLSPSSVKQLQPPGRRVSVKARGDLDPQGLGRVLLSGCIMMTGHLLLGLHTVSSTISDEESTSFFVLF